MIPGSVVAFHDARAFPGGLAQPDLGPVRVVDNLFRDREFGGKLSRKLIRWQSWNGVR